MNKDKFVTSQLESYQFTIQDQELPTKYLKNKRTRDSGKTPDCNNKCRLCTTNVEDINHIIAGCSHMTPRYHLPLRHDEIAKTVLNSHLIKFFPLKEIKFSSEPEYFYENDHQEYWWNVSVKATTKVAHNKPDLIIWNREIKICSIIEFGCTLDINIKRKVNKKLENYGQLVRNLQIMYPDYKSQVAPIAVGATGSVPKCLTNYLQMIGLSEKESKRF